MRRLWISALTAGLLAVASPASATTGWQPIGSPDKQAMLEDIAVLGPNDAWAVGSYPQTFPHYTPLLRRWNGHTWNKVTNLPAAVAHADLTTISASSAGNVWISGSDYQHQRMFTLRWNGSHWSVISSAMAPNRYPAHLLARAANDVWRFAQAGNASDFKPDVRHYNGHAWSTVTSPGVIVDASARSANDIWAVAQIKGKSTPTSSLVLHWNGHTWTKPAEPNGVDIEFQSINARSDSDVWVRGEHSNGSGNVFLHWNGQFWYALQPVPPEQYNDYGLVNDGQGGFWTTSPISFLHYTGGQWTKTAAPLWQGHQPYMAAIAQVPGTTSVWAVGLFGLTQASVRDAIYRYGP